MAWQRDPRINRPSFHPAPINFRPVYDRNNLTFNRRARYENFNDYPYYDFPVHSVSYDQETEIHSDFFNPKPDVPSQSIDTDRYQNFNYPNYNFPFHSESYEQETEIHPDFFNPEPDVPSQSIDTESTINPEPIDPKLDFCSDSFDPEFFLKQPYSTVKNILPYPKAKEYNNLAEYYSHHFLKKDHFKRVEKDRLYDRDYEWYYRVLGWDENIQRRFEQRKLRKTRKYAGWLTAKLRKYKSQFRNDDPNYKPCRGFPPLQSTKIVQTQSKFRKYKFFPKCLETDNKESTDENLVSDLPELNLTQEDGQLVSTTKEPDSICASKITLISETEKNSTSSHKND